MLNLGYDDYVILAMERNNTADIQAEMVDLGIDKNKIAPIVTTKR